MPKPSRHPRNGKDYSKSGKGGKSSKGKRREGQSGYGGYGRYGWDPYNWKLRIWRCFAASRSKRVSIWLHVLLNLQNIFPNLHNLPLWFCCLRSCWPYSANIPCASLPSSPACWETSSDFFFGSQSSWSICSLPGFAHGSHILVAYCILLYRIYIYIYL